MNYIPTIGIEVHVELSTRTKMFCGCPHRALELGLNQSTCPGCLGFPGALPAVNEEAVRLGIRAALALHCQITDVICFDRKNYMYPDLAKGYQLSQPKSDERALGTKGWIDIPDKNNGTKRIHIRRVHLEEDTARLIHESGSTLLDANRSSAALMEIVTEPCVHSAEDAEEYVRRLRAILVWNGVSACRIQRGEMRVEPNISVAPEGSSKLGTRVEIKNQAGFQHMHDAIVYEIRRHIEALDTGTPLIQETRGYDPERGVTFSQRTKEDAEDYRYFPDPDLPPIAIEKEWIESERSAMPCELDDFLRDFENANIGKKECESLIRLDALGFLRIAHSLSGIGLAELTKFLINDVFTCVNTYGTLLGDSKLTPELFAKTVGLSKNGKINSEAVRKILDVLFRESGDPDTIASNAGLFRIEDDSLVLEAVEYALSERPDLVTEYRSGKVAVRNALFGLAMKRLARRGDPAKVSAILDERLIKDNL